MYHFSVNDTGIGITPEQRQRLFKAFSQADGSTTRKFGGTGLGLVISNLLLKKMDSTLILESEWGSGSSFTFNISTDFFPGSGITKINSVYNNVLVLDNNERSRNYIAEYLKYWNVDFELCINKDEMYSKLEKNSFDLLICSYNVPCVSPSEFANKIKEQLQVSPVVAYLYSPNDQSSIINQNSECAGVYKLSKPLRIDEFSAFLSGTIVVNEPELLFDDDCNETIPNKTNSIAKTILIAEDVEMNMMLVKYMIIKILPDVELVEAHNGLEALNMIKKRRFDLVFMDVQMPEMDGMEATRQIRSLDSVNAQDLPIIALTAGALGEEREKAINSGMNDFLTKPIDSTELKNTILKYLH